MRVISPLILGIVLFFTVKPFSVLAETPNNQYIQYIRPSLLDKDQDYAIVLAPFGCSAFIFNNGADSYKYVCWDADAQIFPEDDGRYRFTLYTGFPNDSEPVTAHPKYKHDYEWEEYRKVYINNQGCLRPYKDGWGIPESMGPCPPTAYPNDQPNIINPYYKREENIGKILDPLFHAIHDFISPLLNDQSMIQHPGDTGTDSNLISNDDFMHLCFQVLRRALRSRWNPRNPPGIQEKKNKTLGGILLEGLYKYPGVAKTTRKILPLAPGGK